MSKDIPQNLSDRVFGIFSNTAEPMSVDEYGTYSITVKEAHSKKPYLTDYNIKTLQKEFEYVHLIQGKIVCSEETN